MSKRASAASAKTQLRRLRLRIDCAKPPDPTRHGAEFGLQEKRAGDWVLHSGTKQPNGDFIFDFECDVKPKGPGAPPDFGGQFVHGKPGERFVYLSWKPRGWTPGEPEPGAPHCVRRMKIHLKSVQWLQVEEALGGDSRLEARVAGTATDGGPNCASVPLIGGWQVRSRRK
jgi:hypothetical protein